MDAVRLSSMTLPASTGTGVDKQAPPPALHAPDSFTPSGKPSTKVDPGFVNRVLFTEKQAAPTTILWVFEPSKAADTPPVVGPDGKIYIADGNRVYALDGANGRATQEFTIPAKVNHFVVSKNGSVYATDESKIYCLDKNDGTIKWEKEQTYWGKPTRGRKHLAVDSRDTLYLTDYASGIHAYDGTTGEDKWFYWATYLPQPPELSSDEKVLYVTDAVENLTAVNARDGKHKWQKERVGRPTGSMLITSTKNRDIIVGYENHYAVSCVNGKTGETRWADNGIEGMLAPAAVSCDGRTVFVPDKSAVIYALDGKTGERKWSFDAGMKPGKEIGSWMRGGEEISVTPAYDGSVIIGREDNTITALDGETGRTKWTFKVEEEKLLKPIAGDDGNIYIRGGSGKIYCLPFDLSKVAAGYSAEKEATADRPIAITVESDFINIAGVRLPIGKIARESCP